MSLDRNEKEVVNNFCANGTVSVGNKHRYRVFTFESRS